MAQSPPKPTTTRPRPISLRASAKSPLTASQSSTASTTTTAANNAQLPATTSHRTLFLTNLRLLDLDQEEDWPDITPSTFSTKDALVGQKKRIQAVEWALYQLFNLWDPEETQNKLRPFYPPLDQVQSINLRAAFTRCLEQAKKNGVLGRDAVIRKTMLDECKGERFEEVLAVFSSAVLKKLVAERALNAGHDYRPSISESIAIENWGYKGERTELNGLLLAHKASLRSFLREKDAARQRYNDFAKLLALKEQTIAKRNEQVKSMATDDPSSQPTDKTRYQVRQMLKMNWTGNEEWTENILYGENSSSKGGLLSTPFEEVWDGVQNGTLEDIEDQSMGLLDQLDQRVQVQRARLEKWDGFRKKLFGDKQAEPSKTSRPDTKGIDLGFSEHLKLSTGTMSPQDLDKLDLPPPPPQYAQLLENMKAELNSDLAGIPDFASLVTNRSTSNAYRPEEEEPVSDLDEWEKELERETKASKPPPATRRDSRLRSPKRRPVVRTRTLNTRPAIEESDDDEDAEEEETEPPRSEHHDPTPSSRSSVTPEQETPKPALREEKIKMMRYSPPLSPPRSQSPELLGPQPRSKKEGAGEELMAPDEEISPTQVMADQILASMNNASPSPLKKARHRLSLTERTRMSMTRTPSINPDEYDEDVQLLSPTPRPRVNIQALSGDPPADSAGSEDPEDLVARTRRSMQGYEAARQKAQLERRRSERKSRMVSPRKDSQFPIAEEDEDVGEQSTFVEELLEKGVEDMELVFRSRPKMRTSPAPSPGRRWDQDLYDDDE
ncbi:arad-like aldolase/epimerase [Apiospora arundinis]